MATFISTLKFTPEGITNYEDTCRRAAAFKAAAKQMGAKVTATYWTLGAFDGVLIFEASDDETAAALLLHLGSLGFVQSQTVRAFTAPEMEKIVAMNE
jgi:uncharacterized protein with GYD domain